MALIALSLRRALADLLQPRGLVLVFLPMLAAVALWGGLALAFGAAWLALVEGLLAGLLAGVTLPAWMGAGAHAGMVATLALGVLILLLIGAVYVTALLITAVFFMTVLVQWVSRDHFPDLQRLAGGSFIGSLGNGVWVLTVYVVLWLLLMPLWLFAPLGFAVALILNAWLNQRLFLYDALAEHASAQELQHIRAAGGAPLHGLSALLALLHFVPVLNFAAPVFTALALTHYYLARLQALRAGAAP